MQIILILASNHMASWRYSVRRSVADLHVVTVRWTPSTSHYFPAGDVLGIRFGAISDTDTFKVPVRFRTNLVLAYGRS